MIRSALIVAFAVSALAAPALAVPVVGQPAPAFSAQDADGKPVSLAALKGKPVVLEWTNEGCPYVQHSYKSGVMQGLQKQAAADGFTWISVISSAPGKQGALQPAEVRTWKSSTGATPARVVLDAKGDLGRLYAAKTTPHMFVIDKAGRVAYMGAIDDKVSSDPADAKTAKNYVKIALADVKAGRPVAEAVTKPYGCSVKY